MNYHITNEGYASLRYMPDRTPLFLIEWCALRVALKATKRNQTKAAKILGVSRSAFREKLKRFEARADFMSYCEGCSMPILVEDEGYVSDEESCYTCVGCRE